MPDFDIPFTCRYKQESTLIWCIFYKTQIVYIGKICFRIVQRQFQCAQSGGRTGTKYTGIHTCLLCCFVPDSLPCIFKFFSRNIGKRKSPNS